MSETPMSSTPQTPITLTSPSSAHQFASLIETLRVDDDPDPDPGKNESTDFATISSFGHDFDSDYYLASAVVPSDIQSLSHQLGIDDLDLLGLDSSQLLPWQFNPISITGNYANLEDGRSTNNWNGLSNSIPSTNIGSTSHLANPYNVISRCPSFSDWVHQDTAGASNSATWLRRGADNLMQQSSSLNDGFDIQSPWIDHSAATRRNGICSVSGWNTSSGISGDIWNRQCYNNGGQDWLELNMLEATNEYGSKKLQKILGQNDERKTNMIFQKTLEDLVQIMTNKYGQFLFAKLIESCNPFQLQRIVMKATSQVETLIAISCHQYGSQCVKRLIKVLEKSPLVDTITLALSCWFFDVMIHKTGSFTILKCFEILNCQQNEALYTKLINRSLDLATHVTGCISLNRSISHIKGSFRDDLLHKISSNAAYLAHDPSGNFVIQHVVGLANPIFNSIICQVLRQHYVELSTKKGGSHVVERCLKSENQHHVVKELLNCDKLSHIARDQYGNYVLQTALRETKRAASPLHQTLLDKISSLNGLRRGYGRNVMDFINKGVPLDDSA